MHFQFEFNNQPHNFFKYVYMCLFVLFAQKFKNVIFYNDFAFWVKVGIMNIKDVKNINQQKKFAELFFAHDYHQ